MKTKFEKEAIAGVIALSLLLVLIIGSAVHVTIEANKREKARQELNNICRDTCQEAKEIYIYKIQQSNLLTCGCFNKELEKKTKYYVEIN